MHFCDIVKVVHTQVDELPETFKHELFFTKIAYMPLENYAEIHFKHISGKKYPRDKIQVYGHITVVRDC